MSEQKGKRVDVLKLVSTVGLKTFTDWHKKIERQQHFWHKKYLIRNAKKDRLTNTKEGI